MFKLAILFALVALATAANVPSRKDLEKKLFKISSEEAADVEPQEYLDLVNQLHELYEKKPANSHMDQVIGDLYLIGNVSKANCEPKAKRNYDTFVFAYRYSFNHIPNVVKYVAHFAEEQKKLCASS